MTGPPAGNGSGVLLRVALEVNFHALWQETLATGTAAAGQDVATVCRLRAGAEAKLLLARTFGWLVGSECLGHVRVGW